MRKISCLPCCTNGESEKDDTGGCTPNFAILPDNAYRRILVVEDNHISVEIMRRILRTRPVSVESTEDGMRALEYITTRKNLLSLLIIDVHIPSLDGLTLLKCIRDRKIHIPAIIITADKNIKLNEMQYQSTILYKPITSSVFLTTVDTMLAIDAR